MLRERWGAGERTGEAKGALEAARPELGSELLHPRYQLIIPDVKYVVALRTAADAPQHARCWGVALRRGGLTGSIRNFVYGLSG